MLGLRTYSIESSCRIWRRIAYVAEAVYLCNIMQPMVAQTRIKMFFFKFLLPRFVSDRHYVKCEQDGLRNDENIRKDQIRNHRLTRIWGRYAMAIQTMNFVESCETALNQIALQIRNAESYIQKDVALLKTINIETLAGYKRVKQSLEIEMQFASNWLQGHPQSHFLFHVLRQRENGRTGLMTGWLLSKMSEHFKDRHGDTGWTELMKFLNDEKNMVYRPDDLIFPLKSYNVLQQRVLRFDTYCKYHGITNMDFIRRLHGDWQLETFNS